MVYKALTPWHYTADIKFFGKPLPHKTAENCVSASISQSIDSVTELTMTFVDPYLKLLGNKFFQPKVAVDYIDYKLTVAATETTMVDGVEGVTIRCRPLLVQKLKDRQGALVMKNVSPAEFVTAETKAAGGVAVVQPLAKRAQVSRDVPTPGETYQTDDRPSSWTTFRRLADENGYLMFEHSNVIYFGKPSWILSTAPMGAFELWYMDRNKANSLTMPICSRSIDSDEQTVSVSLDPAIAIQARPGKKLIVKDMPTFSRDYLISSVSYSLIDRSSSVQVQATTMKDPTPSGSGVTDAQLNQWASGGEVVGNSTGGSTGVAWLDAMMKQLSTTSTGVDWSQFLKTENSGGVAATATMGNVSYGGGLNLSKVQLATAATIIETTYKLGWPKRAAIIAVATAKQESDLGADKTCYKPNSDYDAGVFQQRVLKGWYGTLEQVNNVVYGTTVFLEGKKLTADWVRGAPSPAGPVGYTIPGLRQIKNWQSMSLTQAAQAVQRSAYPNAYAKWESLATKVVDQYIAASRSIAQAQASLGNILGTGSSVSGGKHPYLKNQTVTCIFGKKGSMWSAGYHTGVDFAASVGTPCYAVTDGVIVNTNWGSSYGIHVVLEIADKKRFAYCHLSKKSVSTGQKVKAAQLLGYTGNTGNTSGPHLHIEARTSPYRYATDSFDGLAWYAHFKPTTATYSDDLRAGGISGTAASKSKSVLEFVRLCKAQTGDKYVYGAEASASNANPSAWDCSELVEWACARVGVYIPDGSMPQWSYCKSKGTDISVSAAAGTFGALLFRNTPTMYHVAVSLGNNRTIEAVSSQYGVREMSAIGRGFTNGARIPGMLGYVSDSLR